jgi:predicted transcriptional regulator
MLRLLSISLDGNSMGSICRARKQRIEPMTENDVDYLALAADVVSAYVSNNSIARADLAPLISSVYASLAGHATAKAVPEKQELVPAVSIKKSITPDYIICLEDGKKFKSLKRHLNTRYGMSPDDYRSKWGLPSDYPMVAPNYAASRSELAKKMGLGQVRQKLAAAAVEEPAKKARGRKKAS